MRAPQSSGPLSIERWPTLLRLGAAAASAAILSLAFPPVDIRWFAFLGLIPLVLAFRGTGVAKGMLIGVVWSSIFFAITVSWVGVIDPIALAAVVAMGIPLALLLGALGSGVSRAGPLVRILGWPLLFTGWDLLRGRWPLGGFTFGSLGATQYSGWPLLPLARVGGMFSITLALCVINVVLAEVVAARRLPVRLGGVLLAATVIAAPTFLPIGAVGLGGTLDVAMIQGNVPQGLFRGLRLGRSGPQVPVIIANHVRLTKLLAADPPQLVVWPENSLDRDPFVDPVARGGVAQALTATNAPLLAGAIVNAIDPDHFYNADILFAPDGSVISRYNKTHLVPFGEYVPWKWARKIVPMLSRIMSDGIAGRELVVMQAPGLPPIGPVICFESSYPELVANVVRRGAQIIVVSTNNASFERTALAKQHLAQSVMRAVETGRPVLHAAIAGISAVISPDGKIVRRAGLFIPAILRQRVQATTGETPYVAYGRAVEAGMGAGGLMISLVSFGLIFKKRLPVVDAAGEGEEEFWSSATGDSESIPLSEEGRQ